LRIKSIAGSRAKREREREKRFFFESTRFLLSPTLHIEKKGGKKQCRLPQFLPCSTLRAMPRFSVGLDVGTQGAKAVVFDLESKKVVSRGERLRRGGREPRASRHRKPRQSFNLL